MAEAPWPNPLTPAERLPLPYARERMDITAAFAGVEHAKLSALVDHAWAMMELALNTTTPRDGADGWADGMSAAESNTLIQQSARRVDQVLGTRPHGLVWLRAGWLQAGMGSLAARRDPEWRAGELSAGSCRRYAALGRLILNGSVYSKKRHKEGAQCGGLCFPDVEAKYSAVRNMVVFLLLARMGHAVYPASQREGYPSDTLEPDGGYGSDRSESEERKTLSHQLYVVDPDLLFKKVALRIQRSNMNSGKVGKGVVQIGWRGLLKGVRSGRLAVAGGDALPDPARYRTASSQIDMQQLARMMSGPVDIYANTHRGVDPEDLFDLYTLNRLVSSHESRSDTLTDDEAAGLTALGRAVCWAADLPVEP